MAFNHENLQVYQRTLPFNVKVGAWTAQWDSKHALCDQLSRAAASMLENIAVASAAYSTMKCRGLDYAIGSSLECAACLDLAGIKQLLDMQSLHREKVELSQFLRMLVGLRKSWAKSESLVHEDWVEYSTQRDGIDKACDKARDKGKTHGNSGSTDKLYSDLAPWWPLLAPADDFEEEAALYARVMRDEAHDDVACVLELGSGVGNNAAFLSSTFEMTLVDCAAQMLAVSRSLNPSCEHIEGDMRTLRLDRQFDAVFIHDAIIYMTTGEDVLAVLKTAAAHLRKGGVLLVVPDHTAETFVSTTGHGGLDALDGRGARYLQWAYDPDPDDTTYVTLFDIILRHADGRIETHTEQHTCGLFPRATWLRLCSEAGFDARIVPFMHSEVEDEACEMVVGTYEPENGIERTTNGPE